MFTLYDPFTTRVDSFTPRAGPLVGGTHITLRGSGFDRFGDTRCQFGPLNLEVNASVLGPELMRCDSPSSWMNGDLSAPTVGFTASPLALTLNGQDYLAMLTYEEQLAGDQHPGRLYTHFSMDSLLGLSVASIRPTGGPPVGGTRVTVSGTGFNRVIATHPACSFGPTTAATVDATIVDAHTMICESPPLTTPSNLNLAVEGVVVEVEVSFDRGQDSLFTHGRHAHFLYHLPPTIASIHPDGGDEGGGTPLTIHGTGFRDLYFGQGLQCIFRDNSIPLQGSNAQERFSTRSDARVAVPARAGPRMSTMSTFAPSEVVYCESPPLCDVHAACGVAEDACVAGVGSLTLSVRITNNQGDAISTESANFTYLRMG